jgi:hypothetical protein
MPKVEESHIEILTDDLDLDVFYIDRRTKRQNQKYTLEIFTRLRLQGTVTANATEAQLHDLLDDFAKASRFSRSKPEVCIADIYEAVCSNSSSSSSTSSYSSPEKIFRDYQYLPDFPQLLDSLSD